MPWKEPGDKPSEPRGREPWGHGGRGGPDLEAWLRRLRRRLGPFGRGPLGTVALLLLLLVLWFLIGGWVSVGNQQVGLLLRFGAFEGVLQPGLHLRLPSPMDRVEIVDLGRTRTLSDDVRLLTGDGQVAMVDYFVHYRVTDARKFMFSARDAEESARNAATIAARAVAGSYTLAQLMDRGDDKLAHAIGVRLKSTLPRLDIGIAIGDVGIRSVGVPSEVRPAFHDVDVAGEDARTAQSAAQADVARAKVTTAAKAAALQADASHYRHEVVADAKVEVARFEQLLPSYQAAPQVTRHRLWLDAMHDVLVKNHVVLNTGTGNVIVQFPAQAKPVSSASPAAPATSAAVPASASPAAATSVPSASGSASPGGGT